MCRRHRVPTAQGPQHWGASVWASLIRSPRYGKKGACRSAASSGISHRPSADQRGGHRERRRAVAGMVDRIRASPVVHADETGWRQNWLRVDFQHPHRALLPAGVGARRWWTKRWASRSPEAGQRFLRCLPPLRWPQATVLGRAGHPRPGGALPQGHLAGPVGRGSPSALCRGQVFHPSSGTDGAPLNWPGSGSCWPSASPSWLTRRLSRASCAGASSATSRNSSSSWPNRTCQRTTTPPSAACVIWSSAARLAAAPARSRAPRARDAGIHLRRLARPRFKSSRRLPSAAHFPPSLNCPDGAGALKKLAPGPSASPGAAGPPSFIWLPRMTGHP